MDKIIQKSVRIQAQVIHLPSCKLLWINSCLPNNPGPAAAAWDNAELVTSLAQVESLHLL